MRVDLPLDTSAGPTVPARTDANKRCRRTIPTAHTVRRPLFLYSFGTSSIADAQQLAELVDGASGFIDQSGICQIARRQPIGGSGVLPKATAAHAIDAFAGAQFQDPI